VSAVDPTRSTLTGHDRTAIDRSRHTASLLQTFTMREFKVRYRGSFLDLGWSLLTPLVLLAVYGVILTQVFNATAECGPYLSSAWTGLVIWTFFSTAFGNASMSLIYSGEMLTKVYFPRETVPLAQVGVSLIDLAIGLGTLVLIMATQHYLGLGVDTTDPNGGISVTYHVIAVVPALAVTLVWTAAACVFGAILTTFLRDVGHFINLFLRAGFFATPVMYDASIYPAGLRWLAIVNPIAVTIEAMRAALFCHVWPNGALIAAQFLAGSIALGLSVLYMRRVEDRLVDVL